MLGLSNGKGLDGSGEGLGAFTQFNIFRQTCFACVGRSFLLGVMRPCRSRRTASMVNCVRTSCKGFNVTFSTVKMQRCAMLVKRTRTGLDPQYPWYHRGCSSGVTCSSCHLETCTVKTSPQNKQVASSPSILSREGPGSRHHTGCWESALRGHMASSQ